MKRQDGRFAVDFDLKKFSVKPWQAQNTTNALSYEKLLMLVARHALVNWNFEPEMSIFDAVMGIMATIEQQGGMQLTIGDLEAGKSEKPW